MSPNRQLLLLVLTITWIGGIRSNEVCSAVKADIVFILDSSESIGAQNYEVNVKGTLRRFVEFFPVSPDTIRFAALHYGTTVEVDFNLDDFNNKEDTLKAVAKIPYMNARTATGDAILKYQEVMFPKFRPDAAQIVIVITDGQTNEGSNPRDIMATIKSQTTNVRYIAIGVTDLVVRSELEAIASDPVKDLILVRDYEQLFTEVIGKINKIVCETAKGTIECLPESIIRPPKCPKSARYVVTKTVYTKDASGQSCSKAEIKATESCTPIACPENREKLPDNCKRGKKKITVFYSELNDQGDCLRLKKIEYESCKVVCKADPPPSIGKCIKGKQVVTIQYHDEDEEGLCILKSREETRSCTSDCPKNEKVRYDKCRKGSRTRYIEFGEENDDGVCIRTNSQQIEKCTVECSKEEKTSYTKCIKGKQRKMVVYITDDENGDCVKRTREEEVTCEVPCDRAYKKIVKKCRRGVQVILHTSHEVNDDGDCILRQHEERIKCYVKCRPKHVLKEGKCRRNFRIDTVEVFDENNEGDCVSKTVTEKVPCVVDCPLNEIHEKGPCWGGVRINKLRFSKENDNGECVRGSREEKESCEVYCPARKQETGTRCNGRYRLAHLEYFHINKHGHCVKKRETKKVKCTVPCQLRLRRTPGTCVRGNQRERIQFYEVNLMGNCVQVSQYRERKCIVPCERRESKTSGYCVNSIRQIRTQYYEINKQGNCVHRTKVIREHCSVRCPEDVHRLSSECTSHGRKVIIRSSKPNHEEKCQPHDKHIVESCAECRGAISDIVIIVGTSEFMGQNDFEDKFKGAIKGVINFFNLGTNSVRFALIENGNKPRVVFNFEKKQNRHQLLKAIDGLHQVRSRASIVNAFKLFKDEVAPHFRKGVGKIVIVISNGMTDLNIKQRQEIGNIRAHYAETRFIAVGTNCNSNILELETTATTEEYVYENIFTSLNLRQFNEILIKQIEKQICLLSSGKVIESKNKKRK